MPSDSRLPPPPPVPAEAREVALTWQPPPRVCECCGCAGCWCGQLDAPPVDAAPLGELEALRADLRTLARTHGWDDDEPGDDSCGWDPL